MTTFLRVLRYFRPYAPHLAAALVFTLIVAVCTIYPAWIIRSVVNDVLVRGDMAMLHFIAISLVVVMAVKGVANFIQTYIITWAAQKILLTLRSQCFDRLLHLSLSYYEKARTGELMSRILNDVAVLQHLLSQTTGIIGDFTAFLGFCGYIFYLHWKLALISIVIIPFIGALINSLSRTMKKIGTRMQSRIGDIATVLQEHITGVKVVKSFTLEEFERGRFEKANLETFRENMKGNLINSATSPVIEFINTVGLAIIFWYGGYEVIQKRLDAGELISFLTALVGLFTPIKNISKFGNIVSQSVGGAERVFQVIDAPIEITEPAQPKTLEKWQGAVAFEQVHFAYKPNEPILSGLSFEVKPGEVIALVGPSGAGKSTFVNLIPRFFDVQAGRITIDGIDVRDFRLSDLRGHIGIVPQETLLFSGTIAENIRLGRLDASQTEIEEAARLSNAHDFIHSFPEGYNTYLGERGVNLSGGQAQRIALARAFLKDPPILILDEATSALDSESENLVKDSLNKLMRNRTTFLIAHRLSTIINADKIVVLQNGGIVECGPHKQLLADQGLYSQLYHAQYAHETMPQGRMHAH
ncbi:MAG TPA: ABC transporter ATP-binding protein [Candidatus Ozemobacteraceae bacterium]|nr:ABC transporter ATP-binding protein [Candidatus Ozemobacteraceae bacterium]